MLGTCQKSSVAAIQASCSALFGGRCILSSEAREGAFGNANAAE